MNKINNYISFETIKNAAKLWACCIDGFDGAVGGIYEAIPWKEIQPILEWKDVEDQFSDCIPACPELDVRKIVIGDYDEVRKMNVIADDVARKVCDTYAKIIDELNDRDKKTAVITSAVGIKDGLVLYDKVDELKAETWSELIDIVWAHYKAHKNWKKDDFDDVCYKAIYDDHASIHLCDDFYVQFRS